jgi:hypothetical protein
LTQTYDQARHLCDTCKNLFDCSWKDCIKPNYAKFVSAPNTDRSCQQFTELERCYECEKYTEEPPDTAEQKRDNVELPSRAQNPRINRGYRDAVDRSIERMPRGKKGQKAVIAIRGSEILRFKSSREASITLGINASCIANCLHGRTYRSGGYEWKFAEKEVQS